MLSTSQVSFMKRAVSVLTASMFLLSGIVLTAGPANAASTETVPYTYTVKVPVTKTVYEYQVVKTKVGNRTVYTYQRVAKTKTEYRVETRTGYREAPVKAADKPAAAEFKVQVADTASFQTVKKEIKVVPAASGTNKVNLSNQLAGSVGDVAYVRVVAKNAAGKSTAGRVSKLVFGEVSRSTYEEPVQYTAIASRVATAGYWYSYTDYSKPIYSSVYRQTGGGYNESYWVPASGYYGVTGGGYYYSTYVSGYYQSYSYQESYTTTCYYLPGYYWSAYSCTQTRTVSGSYWVSGYWRETYVPPSYGWISTPGYWDTRYVAPTYGYVTELTGYGSSDAYVAPTYENYSYTATRNETRTQINNGWKASN